MLMNVVVVAVLQLPTLSVLILLVPMSVNVSMVSPELDHQGPAQVVYPQLLQVIVMFCLLFGSYIKARLPPEASVLIYYELLLICFFWEYF